MSTVNYVIQIYFLLTRKMLPYSTISLSIHVSSGKATFGVCEYRIAMWTN